MCVCLCFDVTKKEIKKAIRDGHNSVDKLTDHLQVGSRCGGCLGHIEDMLEKKNIGLLSMMGYFAIKRNDSA